MKVARLYGFNDIRIEEMPVPKPGPGEALIKTKASGICSGDVMRWYIEKKAPLVLGHEPAGEVVETGTGVTTLRVGDRVFVHHHAPCFSCRHCRRGDYVQCRTWKAMGISPGGISEYILVSENALKNDTLHLPETLSYEDGAIVEPFACAIKALKRARIRPQDTVLIIGLGFMGVLCGLVAMKYGAGRVIGAEKNPYRINKAQSLGFKETIDATRMPLRDAVTELTSGEMADIVVVAPSGIEALKEGISLAGAGGTVLMFSPVEPDETLTLRPNDFYFRDINFITSYSCGPADTADALELIERGVVRAKDVVTHRFPIEQTSEAYRLTASAAESLKTLIVFQ